MNCSRVNSFFTGCMNTDKGSERNFVQDRAGLLGVSPSNKNAAPRASIGAIYTVSKLPLESTITYIIMRQKVC